MLSANTSCRGVEAVLKISKITAGAIRKRFGIRNDWFKTGNWPKRNRTEYMRQYEKQRGMNQYELNLHRDHIRACVALWLSKCRKAQSLDKLFSAMRIQFPDLTKQGLQFMLNRNVEMFFRHSRHGYSFHPSSWYVPRLPDDNEKPDKRPQIQEAYNNWFRLHKMKDKNMDRLKQHKAKARHYLEVQAISRATDNLKLLAAAAAISQIHENNR